MLVWIIEIVLRLILLPVLLLAATPFIFGFSVFGKDKYSAKLKKGYLKVANFWNKYI
jgi:hypothetical protein